MKIVICTFAYALSRQLRRMIQSTDSRHHLQFYIAVHSDNPDVQAVVDYACLIRSAIPFTHGYNRGLARSLNDMLLRAYRSGADVVINCNDDVTWGDGDVDRLAEAALAQQDRYLVAAFGTHANRPTHESLGWCCAAINPIALEKLGCLDENFFPAYFEDVDYTRRAHLAGLTEGACETTHCEHEGSATIMSDLALRKANDLAFVGNEAYWRRKWGPNTEYTTPFNGGGSLRIEPANRRAPFGGHDRLDLPLEPLTEEPLWVR